MGPHIGRLHQIRVQLVHYGSDITGLFKAFESPLGVVFGLGVRVEKYMQIIVGIKTAILSPDLRLFILVGALNA